MQAPDTVPPPPDVSRARLAGLTLGALLLATLLFVLFVLPAEFRIDPTGVGRASGLTRLAGARVVSAEQVGGATAQPGVAARYYDSALRDDFVDIALSSAESAAAGSELEYKVRMKAGASLVYAFEVPAIADPEEFYFDFHGEADKKGADGEPLVVEYLQSTGKRSSGMLVAPVDGIYGWYLQNQSVNPVVVHLKISGFYDLIVPGANGNLARVQANMPIPQD